MPPLSHFLFEQQMRLRFSVLILLLVAVLGIIVPIGAAKKWKQQATGTRKKATHKNNEPSKKLWRGQPRKKPRQNKRKQNKERPQRKPTNPQKRTAAKRPSGNRTGGKAKETGRSLNVTDSEVRKRFVLTLGPHASRKVVTRQVRNLRFYGKSARCQVLRFFPQLRMLKVRCGIVRTPKDAILINDKLKQLTRVSDSTPDALLTTAPSTSGGKNDDDNGGPETPMFRKPSVRMNSKTEEGLLPYNWGLDRIDEDYSPLDNKPVDFSCYPKKGAGVRVFVIDTGCRINHNEFLNASISTMPAPGSTFENGIDDHGHGSHISGIIAGANVGIARNADITCIKAFDKHGNGAATDTISAVEYVIEQKFANSSVPFVVNLSYSALTGTSISPLDEMVHAASSRGIVFVVSAGNAAVNSCLFSPSKAEQALTVAASTKKDNVETDSNIGPCVELIAPGHQIVSAGIDSNSDYEAMNGTSMATPHIVGLSALVLAENPWMQAEPRQVRDRLYDTLVTARSVNVSNFIMPLMETECEVGESAMTKRASMSKRSNSNFEDDSSGPPSSGPVPVTALPSASPSPLPTASFSPFPSPSPSPSAEPAASAVSDPTLGEDEGDNADMGGSVLSGPDAFMQYGFGPADDPYAFAITEDSSRTT